jgi:hypothetical protein
LFYFTVFQWVKTLTQPFGIINTIKLDYIFYVIK